MDRLTELRRHIAPGGQGLEIAPYFNPVVPKSQGYDVRIVDVFDTEHLRRNAAEDPEIPDSRIAEIEEVDIVCDASRLGDEVVRLGIAGTLDFIVSSHNFEHLPDPVRFLQGCAVALRPGGVLTMAIPDYRACFDHFRMPTRLADWLSAHAEGRTQPSAATIFDFRAGFSLYAQNDKLVGTCRLPGDDPVGFEPQADLRLRYANFLRQMAAPGDYEDAHCSTVFPELFALLIGDLRHLGLIELDLIAVTETRGFEFFVHLRRVPPGTAAPEGPAFEARRLQLLRMVNANLGAAAFAPGLPLRGTKSFLRSLIGVKRANWLQQWNRARRARRRAGKGPNGAA
jgi:predicted SAM-dependent methyltransferase